MNTFISESVGFLCRKHGEGISELNILLPTKRAQLFFNIELSNFFKGRAIWQPKYLSMDSLCEDITQIKIGNKIKLLIELYNIYKTFHDEPFDKFYSWGEMILADFDAIDNYMLDAKKVFCNINDLNDIDALYEDIAQEQRDLINNFWSVFSASKKSAEKESFQNIWNTLHKIYEIFNQRLKDIGIGYKGMIYKITAETLIANDRNIFAGKKYAVVGFNALSTAEKRVFDKIKDSGGSDFLWDYDKYYIDNKSHEAGTFIRENIFRYGEIMPHGKDNFSQEKQVNIVNAPSDSLQCKYVWDFLTQCHQKAKENGKELGKETAIVLTDQSLLLPILYSIPEEIKHFNITAGYPITQTSSFTLFEYLIRLFSNTNHQNSKAIHHKDLISTILNHPIVSATILEGDNLKELTAQMNETKKRFISVDSTNIIVNTIFNFDKQKHISQYLFETLNAIGKEYYKAEQDKINLESMFRIVQEIEQTNNIFHQTNFMPSNSIYTSSIRKHLHASTIAFEGEPLVGVQIMGILETRNIDFENVLILSMNDDNYPGSSVRRSFIPHSLKLGLRLPTHTYQEAMYTYYFYRLTQRAKRVDIAYCSSSEGVKNGEVSRYVYQMKYEKTHKLNMVGLSLKVNNNERQNLIEKDELYKTFVTNLTQQKRSISPSAIDDWVNCQARFYYKRVLKISQKDTPQTTLSAMDFGNAVHNILDTIYSKLKGRSNNDTKEALKTQCDNKVLGDLIEKWIEKNFPDMVGLGSVETTKKFILSYLKAIIKFDINRTDDYFVTGIEEKISCEVELNEQIKVKLFGVVDRIDSSSNIDMITDYKTGKQTNVAATIAGLFDDTSTKLNKPFAQSLIYCYMYNKKTGREVFPSLYFAKEMVKPNYENKLILTDRGNKWTIDNYRDVADELEECLIEILLQIVDTTTPLIKTADNKRCTYCDFKNICLK